MRERFPYFLRVKHLTDPSHLHDYKRLVWKPTSSLRDNAYEAVWQSFFKFKLITQTKVKHPEHRLHLLLISN